MFCLSAPPVGDSYVPLEPSCPFRRKNGSRPLPQRKIPAGMLCKYRKGLVFGASRLPALENAYPVRCLGRLHDAITLRLAYAAADVFVCPSREENLPNTVMESLACGTPVAGFHVGGIPDMVEHEVSGWLAPCYDMEHLALGIASMLKDARQRKRMGEAGHAKVLREYAADVVARRYMALYDAVLATSSEARKTHS